MSLFGIASSARGAGRASSTLKGVRVRHGRLQRWCFIRPSDG
jgi:hypothetical protein